MGIELDNAKDIIKNNQTDLAFVIGNGVNRYNNSDTISWKQMLTEMWRTQNGDIFNEQNLQGLSLTELYDLISLNSSETMTLKDFVVEKTNSIKRSNTHDFLLKKFQKLDVPVLTLNFDQLLEHGLSKFELIGKKKFTDYYPWNIYYSSKKLQSPLDSFAIWHINGMTSYKRSIRLSLSEYMKQVVRTNSYIQEGVSLENCDQKNTNNWNGFNTWLHVIFNKSLFIFGLALNQDEVFLRWLLIQREKYFKKYPDRVKKSWYICPKNDIITGTKFFLQQLNFQIIELDTYTDIYENMFE